MDKLIKKITRLLSKAGVDPETIDKVVSELAGEEDEQENPTLGDIAPEENNDAPTEDAPLPPAEEDGTVPPDETLPPVEEAPVEDAPLPVPPVEDGTPAPLPNEVNPADLIPPTDGQVPPEAPTPDVAPAPVPGPDVELQNKIEEQDKTIEGLLSRIDALEEALKASGVLTEGGENGNGVGLDNPRTPANNPMDDPMESVLAKINGKGRF